MANITLGGSIRYMHCQFPKTTRKPAKPFQRISYGTEADAPTISTSPESGSFTVQYLMNSCKLPLESALLASQNFQLEKTKSLKHQSELSLLRSFQFSDDQIAKLVSKSPFVLQSRVHNNLRPKLQYLMDNGFVDQLLPELIVTNPGILFRSLDGQIKPSIELLKAYIDSDEEVVAAVKRSSWLLAFDLKGIMKPNIELLLGVGVPHSGITKLMAKQPRTIMLSID